MRKFTIINKSTTIKKPSIFDLVRKFTYINTIFKILTKNNKSYFIIFCTQATLLKKIIGVIVSKNNKNIIKKYYHIFYTQSLKKKERFKIFIIYLQSIKQINIQPILLMSSNLNNNLFKSTQINLILKLHFIFIPIYFFNKKQINKIKPVNIISIYQFNFNQSYVNKKLLVKLFAYINFLYLYVLLLLKKHLIKAIIKQVSIYKKKFIFTKTLLKIVRYNIKKKKIYKLKINLKIKKENRLKNKILKNLLIKVNSLKNKIAKQKQNKLSNIRKLKIQKIKELESKIYTYKKNRRYKKRKNIISMVLIYFVFFKSNNFLSANALLKKKNWLKKNKFKSKILKNKTSGRRKQQRKWPQIYKKIRLLKRIRLSVKKKSTRVETYKLYYRNRIKIRLFINKTFKHTIISKILIKENYIKKKIKIKSLNLFLSFLLVRLLVIPTLYMAFFLIKKHYIIVNGLIIKNPYHIINIKSLNIITISYFCQRILFISRQYKRLAQYRLQEKYIFKVKRNKWNPKRYLKYIRWRQFEQLFKYPNSKGITIPLIYNKKYTKIQALQAVNRINYKKIFYSNFLQYNCYISYYKGYHRIRRRYRKLYYSVIRKRSYLKKIKRIKNKIINKFSYNGKIYLLDQAKYCNNWLNKIKKQYKHKTNIILIKWYIKNHKNLNNFYDHNVVLLPYQNYLNKKKYQKLKNYLIKFHFYKIITDIKRIKKITLQMYLIKKLFYILYKHWARIKIEIRYLNRLKNKINLRKIMFNKILINYYQLKLYTPNLNNKYYINAYFIINTALKKINLFRKQNKKFRYISRFTYHSRYYKPQREYNKKFRSRFNSSNSNNIITTGPIMKKNINRTQINELKKRLNHNLLIRKYKKIDNKIKLLEKHKI
jgi:hypothetical protein